MSRKPNLLFLFTDEQRADTLSCYGNDYIQMPHLNRFAQECCIFENGYVTQAVCTPSRASIMTGLYPHTCGCTANNIPLHAETPTIAEMLPSDYRTGYFGKWHLGDEVIAQHGFQEWISIEDFYRQQYSREEYLSIMSDYHQFLCRKGLAPSNNGFFSRDRAANMPVELTKAGFLAGEASRFLRDARDEPFCLYVNFLEPHMPFFGPLNGLHDPDTMPVAEHFLQPPREDQAQIKQLLSEFYRSGPYGGQFDLTTEAGWRLMRSWYYGLCSLVDRSVGQILAALEESGQAENTIVVFTSDHGDMMGDHACVAKTLNYEEAVRVPWLMRLPGQHTARRIPGRASQVDLVPTLLELMGAGCPDHLEGNSLAPVLRGEADLSDNDVVIEWQSANGRQGMSQGRPAPETAEAERISNAPWRTLISADGWKLSLSPDDHCELFDLNTDPHEQQNRFCEPTQATRIDTMTSKLRAWQAQTNDTTPLQ